MFESLVLSFSGIVVELHESLSQRLRISFCFLTTLFLSLYRPPRVRLVAYLGRCVGNARFLSTIKSPCICRFRVATVGRPMSTEREEVHASEYTIHVLCWSWPVLYVYMGFSALQV